MFKCRTVLLLSSITILLLHTQASPIGNEELLRVETVVKLSAGYGESHSAVNSVLPDIFEKARAAWKLFKSGHSRIFSSAEEDEMRFVHFLKNFLQIQEHNKLHEQGKKTYKVAVNKFSDWTDEEIKSLNGFKHQKVEDYPTSLYMSPATNLTLPSSVDWRNKGYVTEVKNQGQCGSCWSFSTTGSLEGQHFRKTGKLIDLSEQQLVDCDFGDNGCNGGLMSAAFEYIQRSGGLELESQYPYVSGTTRRRESTCRFHRNLVKATVTGAVQLKQGDEEALKEAVATVGPVSVAIDVTDTFMRYSDGVYESDDCTPVDLNHAVLIVGYGVENGVPYWLVKNSWGSNWGQNGYIKMRRNHNNMCGIATFAIYPLV